MVSTRFSEQNQPSSILPSAHVCQWVQHIVWAGNAKKYVPGLITAPIHIVVFLVFYSKAIF